LGDKSPLSAKDSF
jgi:hypothetical protein